MNAAIWQWCPDLMLLECTSCTARWREPSALIYLVLIVTKRKRGCHWHDILFSKCCLVQYCTFLSVNHEKRRKIGHFSVIWGALTLKWPWLPRKRHHCFSPLRWEGLIGYPHPPPRIAHTASTRGLPPALRAGKPQSLLQVGGGGQGSVRVQPRVHYNLLCCAPFRRRTVHLGI